MVTKKEITVKSIRLIIGSILLFSGFMPCYGQSNILWYDGPASEWEEALPLGNGRLGIMVFGDPEKGRIQLNDDSLWPGDQGWDEPEGNPEDLKRIRQLLFEGRNEQADEMFVDKFSRKKVVRSHQTLGDLFIELNQDNISDYRRTLDISKAISTVTYKSEGQQVTQETFVSHPHQAIFIKMSIEGEKGFSGLLRMSRPQDKGHNTVKVSSASKHLLLMEGMVTQRGGYFNNDPSPILGGVQFETRMVVSENDGELIQHDSQLELKNVHHFTLKIVSNSSFYHDDYKRQNVADLDALEFISFDKAHEEHIKDHEGLFNRVDLKLTDEDLSRLTTDDRLERVKEGHEDLGLESLLYQYGRYLLIASSRPGSNPANLQGLWNEHIEAPWNNDYHLNINLQMNYWLSDMTNLSELNEPLFEYVDKLIENGKQTARVNFGCRGTFLPHATDLWAPTWLRAPTAYWGCSVGAGGWMVQHYWDHFEYTRDTSFLLATAFPAIEAVSQFYSDWLIEDPRDGYLISAPSTSPENRFVHENGKPVATCLGSAMDQQVIAEVFDNYITACSVLKINGDMLAEIQQQRNKLRPGFVTGRDGRILEWDREYEELEKGHRHMSHLYGFHPGSAVSIDKNPEIFESVRKTLDYRLENGGAGTGWSRAWLINCAARLFDGEKAHEHIQLLLQKSIYDNLFDGHPPFQIDGNFGYTAGLTEMLLQSHEDGLVRILPALPESWKEGNVSGLKARGGLEIDISWKNNTLEKAVIRSKYNQEIQLGYKGVKTKISLKKGESYHFKTD